MFLTKKLTAGALQYTLFISVLILLLISAFLLLTHLHLMFKKQSNLQIECIQNCAIGFDYVTVHEIADFEQKTLSVNQAIESTVLLEKKDWGIFDVLKVTSTIKDKQFSKFGLMGGYLKERPALYLKDVNNALVVVGNTKIQGAVYLPEKSVKRGNIAGHSYYSSQLIYGEQYTSKKDLPLLKNKQRFKMLSEGVYSNLNENSLILNEYMYLVNSFEETTKTYVQNGIVSLKNISLTGNCIIKSDTLIEVYNSSVLNDVLLFAPNIVIKNGVQGSFQAFASTSITIEADCILNYPTCLVVYEDVLNTAEKSINASSQILIKSGSLVKGIVAYLTDETSSNYDAQLSIDVNAKVLGEVYCDKNLELKGAVFGSVYTSNFIAKEFGSIYQNHLYNATISQPDLAKQYVGLPFDNTISKVAKWLY